MTKKMQKAIRDAVFQVFREVCEDRAPNTSQNPPETWHDDERQYFDALSEMEYRISKKLDALFGVKDDKPRAD